MVIGRDRSGSRADRLIQIAAGRHRSKSGSCDLLTACGVGDVGSIVLRDRKHLAQDGLIIVVVAIEILPVGEVVVAGPDIVSRGFVYVREAEDMMSDARRVCLRAVDRCREQEVQDWGSIKNAIKDRRWDSLSGAAPSAAR